MNKGCMTDLASLHKRMMQQREAALTGNTPSFEDCEQLVCDVMRALKQSENQLEAEHQRADMLATQLEIAVERSGLNFERAMKAEHPPEGEYWYLVSWGASSGIRGTTEVFLGFPWAKGDLLLVIDIIKKGNPDVRGVTIAGVYPIMPPRQRPGINAENGE